ncbi:Protein phosphatase PP2A 55 kDa regulatory subunit [Orchesella cincta]|uniref:Serine/threonine-protein phosphatase 2A 55 kDa regulatory subunit B n=1 Tax=Orchesella cincta TaxID=48709 RepID=A0A1D2MCB1_ORCCI|nr:Protein phosphatase PP2A 55 kDa regulatory subunit [Orchesella cincta]
MMDTIQQQDPPRHEYLFAQLMEPPRSHPQLDAKVVCTDVHDSGECLDSSMISTFELSGAGDFLAVGDRGGKITIYKEDNLTKRTKFTEHLVFQSHDPEFDYLKSLEIEEKINQIKWVPRSYQDRFLLSANDKTVKLWKVGEMMTRSVENLKDINANNPNHLVLPRVTRGKSQPVASFRRAYSNAHAYHINSISVNTDQETFLSSDDLRINMWNLEVNKESFVAVDMKPENMEDLTEVITSASFHPTQCNVFGYSSSKGLTRMCDMRVAVVCDNKNSKVFQDVPDNRGYFSEVITSIGSLQFSNSGRYVATRDFMNVKIWDLTMERTPVQVIPVHEHLSSKLGELYENDSIFDKFGLSWSKHDEYISTGSYDGLVCLAQRNSNRSSLFAISRDVSKNQVLKPKTVVSGPAEKRHTVSVEALDLDRKVGLVTWGNDNLLFAAVNSSMYVLNVK